MTPLLPTLLEAIPDAMVVVDEQGRIVQANAQAHQLFDYDDGAMIGMLVEDLVPDAQRRNHQAHRSAYMRNPRVRPMGKAAQTLTGRRREGTEFPVEIALSPLPVDSGICFLASIRDVSESQRARQALLRARYDAVTAQIGQLALESTNERQMMATLPDLLAATIAVDAVALVLASRSEGEVVAVVSCGDHAILSEPGRWTAALDPPLNPIAGDRPLVIDDLATADTTDSDRFRQFLTAAGIRSLVTVPLLDLHRPMGMLVAASLTPGQFDHDALHLLQSAANLMAANMQRRRSEEQLAHAQRLDAVGQLTGGIAHDFNNLLTVITGNLQLLQLETQPEGGAGQAVESALRAAQRGAELTAKLLAFARRQRLNPSAIDPHPLLEELGRMLRRTLDARIQLDIDCATNLPAVHADAGQLDTALINLVLNARDAMPRGGRVEIRVGEHRIDPDQETSELDPGLYLVFSVTDTGLGMTPETQARACEPFFTTKSAGQGSGLGLSMVYGFVKQSGGQLHIDSRLGYGTRIDLYLPTAQSGAARTSEAPACAVQYGRERVLVVEDDQAVREVAVAFLRSLGYRTSAVDHVEAALAALDDDNSIALLFSDIVLGDDMNGVELARVAQLRHPRLAVLLTSGYEPSVPRDGDPAENTYEVLRKPYRREQLGAAVRRAIDSSG